ncbi:lactate utilization protein C [Microbulbifer sp. TYP-18]|uniref:lactate utilization protein C n=1 Tax=Microbulbifer sp. TYP-18 TaxID=3230024 RepID=UPI0034C62679
MRSAKATILARLKKHLGDAGKVPFSAEPAAVPQKLDRAQNVDRFIRLLRENRAHVVPIKRDDIARVVKNQLQQRGVGQLMGAGHWLVSLEELEDEIAFSTFYSTIDGHKEALFNSVPAAITGSHCGIASTGSIVLWPDAAEPRSLSLVPPLHIVVVEQNAIYNDFGDLIKSQCWSRQLPSNVVLISGPSKTADIQQTLAYGAHGPRELVVLLVE